MALNSIVLAILVVELSLFASARRPLKPEIVDESGPLTTLEIIKDNGDNFTILCQGNDPLGWASPKVEEDVNSSQISVTDVIPKRYKYGSRLFIYNLTVPFIGYYTCHNRNADPADESQSSKIYLYVRDPTHLSVTEEDVLTVTAVQYTEVLIPCKPTSPDVQVELHLITGEKIENTTYDPKTGFTFLVSSVTDSGYYYCQFTRGDEIFESNVFLDVIIMTESVAEPHLEETSGGHTTVGETLQIKCRVFSQTPVFINWTIPAGELDPNRMSNTPERPSAASEEYIDILTVEGATLADKGRYICTAHDNQNHSNFNHIDIIIYGHSEHFINLTEGHELYSLSVEAGKPEVTWRIDVQGHPQPMLEWRDNYGETIKGPSSKYNISLTTDAAVLTISDVEIGDYGNYTLVAENKFETKSLSLFLNVTDQPTVELKTKLFYLVNKTYDINCTAAAYPKPSIFWVFRQCQNSSCPYITLNETRSESVGLQLISHIRLTPSQPGNIKCSAVNQLGIDESDKEFLVSDIEDGFSIFGFDPTIDVNATTAVVAVKEPLKMICGISVYNSTDTIDWFHDGVLVDNHERYTLSRSRTQYSNRLVLDIPEIDYLDGGVYSCQVRAQNKIFTHKNITVTVLDPVTPVITKTNLTKDVNMHLPRRLGLFCEVFGVPKPKIEWFKNDKPFELDGRVKIDETGVRIFFSYTEPKDEGVYSCEASNKMGRVKRTMKLTFTNKPNAPPNYFLLGFISILVIIVVLLLIASAYCFRNKRKLERELKIAGLANFEKGGLENVNPELGIDDQAELLPYDKKWEFPVERMKLGKQLGSGAFGVVMKAEAKGIVEGEDSTIVAVKMVKKNADNTYIKALASELKIMVHLGQHLNVVNLLGACTKNVAKRELLVIVEYCRFGNLQNYLFRHRENFIDQVDPKTGHIDYAIGQEILERTYSVSSSYSNPQSPNMKYAALSFSNSGGGVPSDMADYRGDNYQGTTGKTETTTVSMSPNSGDEMVISNNSAQPEWRSNYRGDYKGNVKPICTKDLLAWAFQVSRGMDYLASRKVLHGDLAARNILLADNNVVKICDFGLAKSMYKNDNYKKKGDGPLPVKWMAIESIRDRVFSTQSDVWSFGIVLWEFFSLARTPYPGMEADERLYNKLMDGYRMEAPSYAPKEMYKMMVDCWQAKPLSRPTFTKLAERIGSLLEDSLRRHYIDLNDPYLVMNTQRLEDGQSDYLAMFSPPNFQNLSSPNYVNEDSGYLCMKPTTIFSPRPEDEVVFDFNTNKSRKTCEANRNELIPMLQVGNESDSETSACNTPLSPQSYSNPSYRLPPVVEARSNPEKDINSSDNYVNVPRNKLTNGKTNPFSVSAGLREREYVNSNSRDWESINV